MCLCESVYEKEKHKAHIFSLSISTENKMTVECCECTVVAAMNMYTVLELARNKPQCVCD